MVLCYIMLLSFEDNIQSQRSWLEFERCHTNNSMVTRNWHAGKYKVHKLHQRYILRFTLFLLKMMAMMPMHCTVQLPSQRRQQEATSPWRPRLLPSPSPGPQPLPQPRPLGHAPLGEEPRLSPPVLGPSVVVLVKLWSATLAPVASRCAPAAGPPSGEAWVWISGDCVGTCQVKWWSGLGPPSGEALAWIRGDWVGSCWVKRWLRLGAPLGEALA